MFVVFNKQKIYTYLVSLITVILLFCLSGVIKNDKLSIETAVTNERLLPIYRVKTDENKVALTINCAW